MTQQVKSKLGENAKVFRFVSRAEMFKQKRKTYDELDYLKYYTHEVKQAILHSMRSPIPDPLPPLSLQTISFYRRKSQPAFKTKNPLTSQLEGHMIYQSLWILSSIDEKLFEDYQNIVKEFQKELPQFLSANSSDIREMAVITAGNKIIGKEQQILNIVSKDPRQLWVLVNHIYDNKISFRKLFPFIASNQQLAYKTLFELTLTVQKEITQTIVNEEGLKVHIVEAIRAQNQTIRKLAIRIVGNVVAENNEYIPVFMECNILDHLLVNLCCSSAEVRRDACWLLSNLSIKKKPATQILRHEGIIKKLVELFTCEVIPYVQKEITYIFCYLAHFAQKNEVFTLLAHENVLNICYNQLCIQDVDLNTVTLFLLKELLQLGDNFKGEGQNNFFICQIKSMQHLYSEVSKMSYSQENEVSSISEQIITLLEDEQDY